MTVSGGLVLAIFWGYAVYKIIELFATYRGDGGGSVIWTVWEKARRPVTVYVLMFIGPILASTLTNMSVTRANAGLTAVVSSVGQSLGRIDKFFGPDEYGALEWNIVEVIHDALAGGLSGMDVDSIHKVTQSLGDMTAAIDPNDERQAQEKMVEINNTCKGALPGALAVRQSLTGQLKALNDRSHDLENRFSGSSIGSNDPGVLSSLNTVKTTRQNEIGTAVTKIQAAISQLDTDINTLKSTMSRFGASATDLEPNPLDFLGLMAGLNSLRDDLFAWFVGMEIGFWACVLLLIVGFTVGVVGYNLMKEGFGVCMYIVGFVLMCRIGNAIAAPLAPVFMLCLISDKTESYGRSFISFYLSMLFASAGLQGMSYAVGHSLLIMTNFAFAVATGNLIAATTVSGVFTSVMKMAVIIYAAGMGISFMLQMVKRGAALGGGILGGSFPS